MDDLLRERGCRPDFALEFVKYAQYSPHSSTKSASAPRPLATTAMDGGSAGFAGAKNRSATILGQPPSVSIMRVLASFVMRGRSQAVMAAVVFALMSLMVPLLSIFSSAIIALVTLRRGYAEGLAVLGFATLASGLLALLLFANPAPAFAFVLLIWLPPMLLALILRASLSLALTTTASLLVGLLVIGAIHLQMPDSVTAWKEILEPWSQELAKAGLFSDAERAAFVAKQAPRMTGMLAAASALQLVLSLFLARWWQSMLYNPGGFRTEFQALRLPTPIGYAGLLFLLLSLAGITGPGGLLLDLSLLVAVVFVLQGLAVIHAVAVGRGLHPAWLIGLYILWVFAMLPVTMVLTALGLVDIWLDLRARLKGPGKSTNE